MTKAQHTRITFRPPSGAPRVVIVSGKPSAWQSKIDQWVTIRKKTHMSFEDVLSGETRRIGLMDFDTYKVEKDEY